MLEFLIVGALVVGGYRLFFAKTPAPTVTAPNGLAYTVGDFVIVNANDPSFDNLPKLPQLIPAGVDPNVVGNMTQARMHIETLTTPAGAGFIGCSFADTRVPVPGTIIVPLSAIVAKTT